MHNQDKKPHTPRHARLFELIRQQNLAHAQRAQKARKAAEPTDAKSFVEAASSSLKIAS